MTTNNNSRIQYGIVVHGGAGSFVASREIRERRRALVRSADVGNTILRRKGGSSLDAVEEAIKVLEDSRVFNAGSGSSLSLEGKVSADAAIMTGKLDCGAIGNVSVARNPISLARKVMERSDHVLLVGDEELSKFSQAIGFKSSPLGASERRLYQYRQNFAQMKERKVKAWPRNYNLLRYYISKNKNHIVEHNDTVGAVAIDQTSGLCAGVSTGGRWLKLPGRVGDSAVVGAGIYADDLSGAASATGAGEEIIRVGLCKSVCDLM
jgi:beta-aspartyl-peptidase (threonine type)